MLKRKSEYLIRTGLILVLGAFLGWAYVAGSFQYLREHPDELFHLVIQHLQLVGLSTFLAVAIAVPMGILVTRPRFRRLEWVVVNFANIGQTIPSLAVLALAMSYLGLGYQTAVFALWFHSLLPILRNTVAGLQSVLPDIIDAGRGMGMKPMQVLWKLELPNASYAMIAGIRTATVINVGSAALAFLIGGGGLGDFIFTGISLYDTGIMLAGAVPVTALALVIDWLLGLFEKWIVPKGIQREVELI